MGIDYEGYIKEMMQKNPITIHPEAFLKDSVYSRDNPPCKYCE